MEEYIEKLDILKSAKANIKAAITEKTGKDAGNLITDYAEKIRGIETGGGSEDTPRRLPDDFLDDPDYPDLSTLETEEGEEYIVISRPNKTSTTITLPKFSFYDNGLPYEVVACTGKIVNGEFISDGNEVSKSFGRVTGPTKLPWTGGKVEYPVSDDKYKILKIKSLNNNLIVAGNFASYYYVELLIHPNHTGEFRNFDTSTGGISWYARRITLVNANIAFYYLFYKCEELKEVNFINCKAATITTSDQGRISKTFSNCTKLKSIDLSTIDTSEFGSRFNNLDSTFEYCDSLETIKSENKIVSGAINCLKYCYSLKTNVNFDISSCGTSVHNQITDFPVNVIHSVTFDMSGFKNLSKNCIIDVFNNGLADMSEDTENTYKLTLYTAIKSTKLSTEDIAIATEKGWTIA